MLKEIIAPRADVPSAKSYTSYETYLEIASDKRIMEWVDGEIITYMSASLVHQNLSGFLYILLTRFVQTLNLGVVVEAPYPTKLWKGGSAREPDVLFVSSENLHRMGEMRMQGAPDLAIEIISKSSVRQDRFHKFVEYEKAGVKEYWVIDPRPRKQQVDFFVLDETEQVFVEVEPDESNIYRSTVLPDFWLDTTWLWQQPLPNSHLVEADIMRSCAAVPDRLRQMYESNYEILSELDHG